MSRGRPWRSLPVGGWVVALALLSAVTVAAAIAPDELAREPEPGWRVWSVGFVAVSLQAVLLHWRARRPTQALLLVCAVVPLAAGAGLGAATGVTTIAVLVAAYAAVVETPWPRPVAALAAGGLLVAAGEGVRAARGEGLTSGSVGAAVLQGVATMAVAAIAGTVVAARRETTRARTEQTRALAGEQVALTEAAVSRQRTAMARELHDIAAHHLSGIAVMTAALDRQIDTDPAGAKVAVRQVRRQSTALLNDLRSLVALLRDDDPGSVAGGVEPETLGGLPHLVDDACNAGREVQLSVMGTTSGRLDELDVGPLAQLAAYRTVQESLTNAARHAPGAPCEVVVDARDHGRVVLTIRNDRPTRQPPSEDADPPGGFGIIGMRERAELTEARLATGPTPDGGFVVTLALPVTAGGRP